MGYFSVVNFQFWGKWGRGNFFTTETSSNIVGQGFLPGRKPDPRKSRTALEAERRASRSSIFPGENTIFTTGELGQGTGDRELVRSYETDRDFDFHEHKRQFSRSAQARS